MRTHIRGLLAAAIVAGTLTLLLGTLATAAPPAQAPACRWERLSATTPQALYFMGSAWDAVNSQLILNGGLDSRDSTKRLVQVVNLADPDIAKATARTVNPSGAVQDYWGTAGAFRATANADDAEALFWSGGDAGGTGQRSVQTYRIKANTWRTQTAGSTGVVLAAAAADPGRDLVVWVGGVKRCDLFGPGPLECRDAQNLTTLVTFAPVSGDLQVQPGPTGGGPGRSFGGTLVWDSTGGRMLYFGGLDNAEGGRARNTTWALDLSDPDLAKASWSQLATAGQLPPARAFHAAAYDTARNWMVVYGGMGQGFFSDRENALTDTWALDLSATPPRWANLGLNTPGERVGAAMAYATNHQRVVLAGGRRQSAGIGGQQSVSRDVYYLDCGLSPVATPTTSPPPITPSGTPGTPTLPPPITPSNTPGTPPATTPTTAPPNLGRACPQLSAWRLVPDPVIADALANPTKYYGWQQPNNPAVPPGPYNPLRQYLSLATVAKPYHPLFNNVIWKAGCP